MTLLSQWFCPARELKSQKMGVPTDRCYWANPREGCWPKVPHAKYVLLSRFYCLILSQIPENLLCSLCYIDDSHFSRLILDIFK